jgi:tripartite-type tricarboxylate transporter receptor subunit TctC
VRTEVQFLELSENDQDRSDRRQNIGSGAYARSVPAASQTPAKLAQSRTAGRTPDYEGLGPMMLTRRRFGALAASASALAALPRCARAQAYPARAVRLIVGYAPGGATDITARLVAQRLSERAGQSFIVENRPGAGTNLATEQVVQAPADGYTLLVATAANAINATLYEKLSFDFVRDMAPVAGLIRMQNVLEVHPSVPATTVTELIAHAKANPGALIIGSPGIGSPGHVSGELFKMMTGVDMLHVPYRGVAPALQDLIGGRIHVLIDNMATAIEYIRNGQVRALAVTTAFRSPLLPDLPTIGDFVPGYEASSWFGVAAPRNTSAEIIDSLNRDINAVLAEPAIVARFGTLGGAPLTGAPADFARMIGDETEKWGKVVRFSGARAS